MKTKLVQIMEECLANGEALEQAIAQVAQAPDVLTKVLLAAAISDSLVGATIDVKKLEETLNKIRHVFDHAHSRALLELSPSKQVMEAVVK